MGIKKANLKEIFVLEFWGFLNAGNVIFETLYGGQFMPSTQFIILNYPIILSHWLSTTVFLETYPFLMKEPGCRLPTPKGCLPTWLTYWWNLLKLHYCLIGSVPSLAAGLAFGGISALGAYQTSSNPRNVWVMLGKNILTLCNNRPFLSYLWSHFQSKSCCSSFHSHAN